MKSLEISEDDRMQIKRVLEIFSGRKSESDVFYEFCFGLCSPQTTFRNNSQVHLRLVEMDFFHKDCADNVLHGVLRPVRFYRNKTRYLQEVKANWKRLYALVRHKVLPGNAKRWLLVRDVNGMGMKVASHFLRNLGEQDLAIIDTHVLKFLKCLPPRNPKEYVAIENRFRRLADKNGLSIAGLDTLVWHRYSGTSWPEFTH